MQHGLLKRISAFQSKEVSLIVQVVLLFLLDLIAS
jgi:hypothetical protein